MKRVNELGLRALPTFFSKLVPGSGAPNGNYELMAQIILLHDIVTEKNEIK